MTAEAIEPDPEPDEDVDDLTLVALEHPVIHKRLDLSKLNVAEVLSLGDIDDMARELGTDPGRLASTLARNPGAVSLEVSVVLAWIIARKRDPDLDIGTVRRTWWVDLVGVGTRKPPPDPTPARTRSPRSSGRPGSSRTRG